MAGRGEASQNDLDMSFLCNISFPVALFFQIEITMSRQAVKIAKIPLHFWRLGCLGTCVHSDIGKLRELS